MFSCGFSKIFKNILAVSASQVSYLAIIKRVLPGTTFLLTSTPPSPFAMFSAPGNIANNELTMY